MRALSISNGWPESANVPRTARACPKMRGLSRRAVKPQIQRPFRIEPAPTRENAARRGDAYVNRGRAIAPRIWRIGGKIAQLARAVDLDNIEHGDAGIRTGGDVDFGFVDNERAAEG